MIRNRTVVAWLIASAACWVGVSLTGMAYDQYSQSKDLTNCAACHGDFRANPYNEGIVRDPACPPTCDPNTEWPTSLMYTHVDFMVNGECLACHSSGPRFPVLTGSSAGDNGGDLVTSCAGCHGRAADGSGGGTAGLGAGLRQHHWQAGVTICTTCHVDAEPDVFTTAGEDEQPPNYASPGAGAPQVPDDPCNAGSSLEDKVGSLRGLDNDGDGFYDGEDTDCGATSATPGAASGLTITGHDPASQVLSLAYSSGCGSTGNKLVYGAIQDVALYDYLGEACGIGNSGSFNWNYAGTPDSVYILLIGDNGVAEGSYGIDGDGIERPKKRGGCWLPQDLTRRCDP